MITITITDTVDYALAGLPCRRWALALGSPPPRLLALRARPSQKASRARSLRRSALSHAQLHQRACGGTRFLLLDPQTRMQRCTRTEARAAAWTDDAGAVRYSVTFVLTLGPGEVVDVCRIRGLHALRDLDLYSDICPIKPIPPPPPAPLVLGFPLASRGGPYFCSQAAGGSLSHFAHESTYHAVDLDAPVGTPVLAVASGTVLAVSDFATCGGPDTSLFFKYNALTLLLRDGITTVEYVHLAAGSSRVHAGEQVRKGQHLCDVGNVGFCPTAHLHIEAHANPHDEAAPSLPLAFEPQIEGGDLFVPLAGGWYDEQGPRSPPQIEEAQTSGDESSSGGWETVSNEDS
eukprot:CAMPEP_0119354196 /NCGR_PEP_ID=MMETSP1334-20130426/3223_1 /TAXON_ID=127549 /ORGANISM="Calcidiscus leptoporus, Strain RCC1130" /LENGTH=346 /DNA_ID=CAMNT_0007367681 /DNA_START=22 /DNA_END=1063 /DNA_ORIENTATION=-